MGGDAFSNQDVIEDAFLVKEVAVLGIAGPQTAPEVMGIDDLAVAGIGPFTIRDLLARE